MSVAFSKLFIISEENERHTTSVFVASPTPLEEKNFGTIFAIVEIDSTDAVNQEVIELINEEIVQHYYRSTELETELAF